MEKSEKCQQKFEEEKEGGGQKKKAKLDSTSRIVGGHPARMPMPWMVLIYSKEYDWRCGGTLVRTKQNEYRESNIFQTKHFQINSQFVLTAAHCVCQNNMCKREFAEISSSPNTMKVRLLDNIRAVDFNFIPNITSRRASVNL